MRAFLDVVLLVLNLYIYVIIASAIFSWLYAFNIVNSSNQVIATIGQVLYNLTEPALRRIRPLMPNLGGVDLSPIALLLGIFLIQNIIIRYIYPNVF